MPWTPQGLHLLGSSVKENPEHTSDYLHLRIEHLHGQQPTGHRLTVFVSSAFMSKIQSKFYFYFLVLYSSSVCKLFCSVIFGAF